jgi:predicted nucleic acid-binding protein
MIFVDSSAWFAAYVPNDPDYVAARNFLRDTTERLATTDYVVDETLTLLKARGEFRRALVLGHQLIVRGTAQLVWVQPSHVAEAWTIFQGFRDQGWSFTDCVSRVVMSQLGINKAFSFDAHFRQFGTVTVVP